MTRGLVAYLVSGVLALGLYAAGGLSGWFHHVPSPYTGYGGGHGGGFGGGFGGGGFRGGK